jgi:hypothetical protein
MEGGLETCTHVASMDAFGGQNPHTSQAAVDQSTDLHRSAWTERRQECGTVQWPMSQVDHSDESG